MIIRNIELGEKKIAYNLVRSKRAKYIRIEIDSDAHLKLVVPERASLKMAEDFIKSKLDWIEKQKLKTEKRTKRDPNSKINFYLFEKRIKYKFIRNSEAKSYRIRFIEGVLLIEGPDSDREAIQRLYDEWLRAQAKAYIPKRVEHFAAEHNLNFNRVAIKNLKSKWGSCSNKRNLNFNLKLMKYRKEVIDYIVVHELCHLIEMNHSKKFWKLVADIMPNYKELERELKIIY